MVCQLWMPFSVASRNVTRINIPQHPPHPPYRRSSSVLGVSVLKSLRDEQGEGDVGGDTGGDSLRTAGIPAVF